MISAPAKPFPSYKWRWASYAPSEGLNDPPVLLGVLRAWAAHDGQAPSSPEVIDELRRVHQQTSTRIDLARTGDRNLWRNSGQYWTALGLMVPDHGILHATQFGQKVASGEITPGAFATAVVNSLTLPNGIVESDTAEWRRVGLKIKPLKLILEILEKLAENYGLHDAYITPRELVDIVIPLAGAKAQIDTYSEAIVQHRAGKLPLSGWPNCAPGANDERMAREFLLFLANYGLCSVDKSNGRDTERYFLQSINAVKPLTELPELPDPQTIAKEAQSAGLLADIERERVLTSVLARPQQAAFRKKVLAAADGQCAITGVALQVVLEAAHIKPVSFSGNDDVSNGLCLRADIHLMFDTGNLRIDPTGKLHFTPQAQREGTYATLPSAIVIPAHVSRDHIEWRWNYL